MTPETSDRLVRRLSRSVEAVHTVTYYAPEIARMTEYGYRGWWHAYFAYRAAPMGPVPAPVVIATFYNFAPRMVERAVPGVWDILTPAEALDRRQALVVEAFERVWGPAGPSGSLGEAVIEAAELAREAMADIELEARPLAAAHQAMPWPEQSPIMVLWHACTIWREYRGDAHNLALAGAGIDGLESHLLMAAHGRGNQPTITGIRGWTEDEWAGALERLRSRAILTGDGTYTEAGRQFRSDIEATTDDLCARPVATLGHDRSARLNDLLATVTAALLEAGVVPGVWPPPNVLKS